VATNGKKKKTKGESLFWSLVLPTAVSTVVAVVVAKKTTEFLEKKREGDVRDRLAETNSAVAELLSARSNPQQGETVYVTGAAEPTKMALAQELELMFEDMD
jgi:hypothetical protein